MVKVIDYSIQSCTISIDTKYKINQVKSRPKQKSPKSE